MTDYHDLNEFDIARISMGLSDSYLSRTYKRLRDLGAPVTGWEFAFSYDVCGDEDDGERATCQLCGCESVRYVHVMSNRLYFDTLHVGCICAGLMAGNILEAKERERQMKNRTKRLRYFMSKQWKLQRHGMYLLNYKKRRICIYEERFKSSVYYVIKLGDDRYEWKNNHRMRNFRDAQHFVFDLIEEGM